MSFTTEGCLLHSTSDEAKQQVERETAARAAAAEEERLQAEASQPFRIPSLVIRAMCDA